MNQVNIVWPNARIPLFYDKNNCVNLRVECEMLAKLVENSELQILVQKGNDGKQQEVNQPISHLCRMIKILPITTLQCGNINKVYISKNHQIFTSNNKNRKIVNLNVNKGVNMKSKDSKQVIQQKNVSKMTQKTQDRSNVKETVDPIINKQKQSFAQASKRNNAQNRQVGVEEISKIKQKFQAFLQYKHKKSTVFPADTNILSVKQQINMMKLTNTQSNRQDGQENKIQKILIQLQVIEDLYAFQAWFERISKDKFAVYNNKIDQQRPVNNKKQDSRQLQQLQQKQVEEKMRDNCLYMSEAVIKNWDIDLTKQITLKLSPRVSQPNSKKLDYLLNMNNINISMYISEKQDDCIDMHVLKQSFVDGFMRYLTMSQHDLQQEQEQEDYSGLNGYLIKDYFGVGSKGANLSVNRKFKFYAKMPYIIKYVQKDKNNQQGQQNVKAQLKQGEMSNKNKKEKQLRKFVYLHINQNDKIISDPLVVTYSSARQAKQNQIKQQVNQRSKQKMGSERKQQQEQKVVENREKEIKQKNIKQKQKQKKAIQELKTKLYGFINIINIFYEDQSNNEIKTKINVINRLNYLNLNQCKLQSMQNQKSKMGLLRLNSSKSHQQLFKELYKICYQEEINKVIDILKQVECQSSPQNKIIKQQQRQNIPNTANTSPSEIPILITSFANNGKSIMNSILRQYNYKTLYIDMSQMDDTSLNVVDLTQFLQLVFQLYAGQFIFFDNLDAVCYKIDTGDLHRRQERIAAKLLIRRIINFMKVYKKYCIFTAKNQSNIDEQFSHYHLIKLKNPTRQLRTRVIRYYYQNNKQNKQNKQNRIQNENQNQRQMQIYDKDQNILDKLEEIISNSQSMSFGQFSKYVISGHRQQGLFNNDQTVNNFSKLAGVKQAKNTIRSIIERPLKYGFVFKKLPIKLSRGILLYGASGTGKSAIGQSLSAQFKMKFFSVKGSDILSKYIGGSEAAVRDVFEKAMSVSPSIVFFDEFQSIVPRRNSSNTGVTDRVVNQFLCYLDGVASVQGVYIVASSSRPELLDPALLRPGRIDTHIFLDYPSKQQRQQLFSLYSKSISFQTSIQELLTVTDEYSYSDLIGLIKQLRIKQSARIIKRNQNSIDSKIDPKQFKFIDNQFLKQTIKGYKISVTKQQKIKERQKYLAFKRGDAPDISKQKTMLQ